MLFKLDHASESPGVGEGAVIKTQIDGTQSQFLLQKTWGGAGNFAPEQGAGCCWCCDPATVLLEHEKEPCQLSPPATSLLHTSLPDPIALCAIACSITESQQDWLRSLLEGPSCEMKHLRLKPSTSLLLGFCAVVVRLS